MVSVYKVYTVYKGDADARARAHHGERCRECRECRERDIIYVYQYVDRLQRERPLVDGVDELDTRERVCITAGGPADASRSRNILGSINAEA